MAGVVIHQPPRGLILHGRDDRRPVLGPPNEVLEDKAGDLVGKFGPLESLAAPATVDVASRGMSAARQRIGMRFPWLRRPRR